MNHLLLRNIITIFEYNCEYISNIILHFMWIHSHIERRALLLYSCFFWDFLTSHQALWLSILCLPDTRNIGFVYLCMFGMWALGFNFTVIQRKWWRRPNNPRGVCLLRQLNLLQQLLILCSLHVMQGIRPLWAEQSKMQTGRRWGYFD